MIVRFPDVPDVDGPLSLPRPAVFLMGSYDPVQGAAGGWYEEAARYLERYVGAVFYGVSVEFREDFVTWYFHWLNRCEVAVIWLDGGTWSQFEVGVLLGRVGAMRRRPEFLVGIQTGNNNLRRAIEIVSENYGLELHIHDDLKTMLHAARQAARGIR